MSGGEKGRVSLAKLMLSEANFLILDEPTNHLDILSKEILEQALNEYTGTVLYASHDRYFINQTATRILELVNHSFVNYIGNYDYYLKKKKNLPLPIQVLQNRRLGFYQALNRKILNQQTLQLHPIQKPAGKSKKNSRQENESEKMN